DGKILASTGGDNWGGDKMVRLWDVAQGKEIRPHAGHASVISSGAISPDGKIVATARQDGIVHLWEPSTGNHLLRLEGIRGSRAQVSFSSDGQQVISWAGYVGDGTLRVWDSSTGEAVIRLEVRGHETYWMALSDNGKIALSIE